MRLAITRDENQISHGLRKQAKQLKVEIVPLPFLLTKYLQFEIPKDLSLAEFDWILFSSANGVRSFFSWLSENNKSLSYHTKIGAVGSKTAEVVCSEGRTVDFIPSMAYGENLFNELLEDHLKDGDVLLAVQGTEVAFDPAPLFENSPVRYCPVVSYEMEVQQVDNGSIQLLEENDFVLFTSPLSVAAYAEQFGNPLARPVAIGKTTEASMKNSGWEVYHTLVSANVDTVLENLLWN